MAYNSISKLCCNLSELEVGQTHRIIVMPIRDNRHSERAFVWYRDHIYRKGDVLYVVNVIHSASSSSNKSYGLTTTSSTSLNMENGSEEFKSAKETGLKFVDKAREFDIPCKAYLHIDSVPGHAICHFAEVYHATLIIMGSRGLGKVKRTFLGSCSEYVLHHCDIPVLVIPPKKDQEGKKPESESRISRAFSEDKTTYDRQVSRADSESECSNNETETIS